LLKYHFYKSTNGFTKNVELATWVWVVWEKCGKKGGKKLCGEIVENSNMGKVWKICEKNNVEKMWKICEKNSVENLWKTITWEKCGKFVKRIVWEKCGKEYCEKSVENLWKN
jgi:hypothetical protein